MRDILKDSYFSIEYFNDEGLFDVTYYTDLEYDELEYETSIGNHFVGQRINGSFYLFCESDGEEITYNEFKKLLAKN